MYAEGHAIHIDTMTQKYFNLLIIPITNAIDQVSH